MLDHIIDHFVHFSYFTRILDISSVLADRIIAAPIVNQLDDSDGDGLLFFYFHNYNTTSADVLPPSLEDQRMVRRSPRPAVRRTLAQCTFTGERMLLKKKYV